MMHIVKIHKSNIALLQMEGIVLESIGLSVKNLDNNFLELTGNKDSFEELSDSITNLICKKGLSENSEINSFGNALESIQDLISSIIYD